MEPRPSDFGMRYEWNEATVPPPEHYEFIIRIGPGPKGEIEFLPDYPLHDPPIWKEPFPVDDQTLDRLYTLVAERGVFLKRWTELQDVPVGGSLEWLEVTADGERFTVPSKIEEQEALADLYAAIRSLVPEEIWTKLMAQREQYARQYAHG